LFATPPPKSRGNVLQPSCQLFQPLCAHEGKGRGGGKKKKEKGKGGRANRAFLFFSRGEVTVFAKGQGEKKKKTCWYVVYLFPNLAGP